jgi:hypothetical protein
MERHVIFSRNQRHLINTAAGEHLPQDCDLGHLKDCVAAKAKPVAA